MALITGTNGNDTLTGTGGDDVMLGLDGNDSLDGGAGADNMSGGTGNDFYYVDQAGDVVTENGGEGDDRVFASASYVLAGGAEVETLTTTANDGTGVIDLTGSNTANFIYGNDGANSLRGLGGNDILASRAGNDVLDGGTGADSLYGGTGNDFYYVDNAGDLVAENVGEGDDRVFAAASYALVAGAEVETLTTTANDGTGAIDLTGSDTANFIYGNNGVNTLRGAGGNDILASLAGDDTLDGGTGADTMIGATGNDFYYVDNAGDLVTENAGEGDDRVFASVSYALAASADVETLTTTANDGTGAIDLTGSNTANFLYGNDGANTLRGLGGNDILASRAGNDTLDGGTGVDSLYGGTGNDFYYVDNAGDLVTENGGEGDDRVFASVSYILAASAEIETLTTTDNAGTGAIDLTGSDTANFIYGNNGVNTLRGAGGNDILASLAGNDTLDGGTGADSLYGGTGNDSYYVDQAGDAVTENGGEGDDRVFASGSYALAAGAEVETLTTTANDGTGAIDLTGSDTANFVYGNDGANTLRGAGGNDILASRAGNDVLDGGTGNDILVGDSGADTFAFTTALSAGNIDTVMDFASASDKIQLGGQTGEPFSALASGALAASSFVVGASAAQADDYVIYNSATGALLYDADGDGAGVAVQFATLSAGLSLTAADFVVSGPANHAPAVTSGATSSVAENSPASTIVYQAAGTDSDGDRITWSLGGTDAGYLTIDAVTGAVRLVNPADFETKASYSFTVTASDSGSASAARAVTLTITDVADTASTPIINETGAPNDTTNTAQTIDRNSFTIATNSDLPNQALPSATIHGAVSGNNDVDFYAITLQAGEQIVLDIDHTTNSLDSFIRFYGSNGVEIVNNDDKISGDPGSNPPFDHNTDSYLTYRVATSGTYYFSVESFGDLNNDGDDDGSNVGESSGSYSLNVSIGPPANAAQIMDEDIDALISGSQWNHTALTFGFPTAASQYPSGIKEITPASDFSPFTAAQQGATGQLLQLIANVSSLTFSQLTANPGNADIRYAMSDEADVAYAYYPTNGGPSSVGGTAWFNKVDFNNPIKGNYAWMGILHETGHTLGLKHGHEAPAVSFDHDSVEYTVMTYRSFPGDDLNGYTNETWGYPQGLMMLDIAALQRVYGANFSTNNGSSVYTWSATTGEMSINGVGQGGANNGAGGSANRVFMTIWDGGGDDTYDLSNYSTNATIDLRPGEWSTLSSIQLASLGSGHTARGNVANALLYQGNTASLIENAIGGSGANVLIGNQAANHLTGNGGADTFKWMAASDAGTGALADTIMDFVRGSDKIDLSNVDANPATGALDSFHFIGTAAFSNTAGELRYDVTGGNAHVFADLDGNGVADMEIVVNGVTVLATSDFNGATGSNAIVPAAPDGPGTPGMGVAGNGAAAPGSANLIGVAADNPHFFAELSGGGPAHVMAMHGMASLAGPEFYF